MEVNFKAKHIAVTKNTYKNICTKIDLYELTKRDRDFLDNLQKKVDYSKLMPGLCEFDQKRWQKVFDYGIESAKLSDYRTYVAVSRNKPCGFLTFAKDGNNIILDCICDIPVEKNKRVNYTGSTLFCQLFKAADDLKAKCIELKAVIDGPVNVIKKYKEKGFKETGTQDNYIKMSCNKFKIREQLMELLSQISYKSVKKSEEVNLNDLII